MSRVFSFLRAPLLHAGIHMSRNSSEVLCLADGFGARLRLRFFGVELTYCLPLAWGFDGSCVLYLQCWGGLSLAYRVFWRHLSDIDDRVLESGRIKVVMIYSFVKIYLPFPREFVGLYIRCPMLG